MICYDAQNTRINNKLHINAFFLVYHLYMVRVGETHSRKTLLNVNLFNIQLEEWDHKIKEECDL